MGARFAHCVFAALSAVGAVAALLAVEVALVARMIAGGRIGDVLDLPPHLAPISASGLPCRFAKFAALVRRAGTRDETELAMDHFRKIAVRFGRARFPLVVALVLVALPAYAGTHLSDAVAAYERGDYAAAHSRMLPFAIQGDAEAQHNLGVMYEYGRGVPQDDSEAVR